MSLDYDLRNLDEKKRAKMFPPQYFEDDDTPYMSNKLESMIFWTMGTGIGQITEKNYVTAFYRYLRASGYDGFSPEKPYLTLRHFEAAIGLRTNVTNMTNAAWLKWQEKKEAEDVKR